jgi:hypothetical protein
VPVAPDADSWALPAAADSPPTVKSMSSVKGAGVVYPVENAPPPEQVRAMTKASAVAGEADGATSDVEDTPDAFVALSMGVVVFAPPNT